MRAVPTKIQDLFANILKDPDEALVATMQWVLFASRPLELEGIYFAIRTSIGGLATAVSDARSGDRKTMENFVLDSSRGLIEMTQLQPPTAQFIHESVREYLLRDGLANLDNSLRPDVSALSNVKMARWCQTYLELDLNTLVMSNSHFDVTFIRYAVDHIFDHLELAQEGRAVELTSLCNFPVQTWIEHSNTFANRPMTYLCDSASLVLLLVMNRAQSLAEAVLAVSSAPSQTYRGGEGPSNAAITAKVEPLFHYDPNAPCEGRPILLRAAELGFSGVVSTLVQHGADVNAITHEDGSALTTAIAFGMSGTVQVLLDLGAHFEPVGRGVVTPLALAAVQGSTDIARSLLAAGARVNAVDRCYETALIAAVLNGDQKMVQILLDHGADIDAVSLIFGTAADVASRRGNAEIVQLLANHRRNPETRSPRYLTDMGAGMLAKLKLRMF